MLKQIVFILNAAIIFLSANMPNKILAGIFTIPTKAVVVEN